MAYTMLPQEDDGMNGYGGNGLSFYTGASTTLPSGYYGDPVALPGGGWTTEQTNPTTPARNERTQGLYAGYGYDVDQWNKRMDAQSAADTALRAQQGYNRGGSTGSRSYGTPAQYAASQPMALQINSLPKLSLTTPQYKPWDASAEQSEVYKAVAPMLRDKNREVASLIASVNGLEPTARLRAIKDIIQRGGDMTSKAFGTANQIGGQRYINKLNYDNQQAAQNAQIANQQAIADHTQKMSAIDYNLKLGQQGQSLPKYRYTDYS